MPIASGPVSCRSYWSGVLSCLFSGLLLGFCKGFAELLNSGNIVWVQTVFANPSPGKGALSWVFDVFFVNGEGVLEVANLYLRRHPAPGICRT
jgi:hypothetical protein